MARRRVRPVVQLLERRQLLSFSNADVSGPWAFNAMGASGTVIFDGAGALTGGAVVDASGAHLTPTGSYAVTGGGMVSVTTEDGTDLGGLNAAKDTVAVSAAKDNRLTLLTNSGSGTFSNADLSGTWSMFINGDAPDGQGGGSNNGFTDNSGHGALTFDGAGHFSGTFIADESNRSDNVTGTYSVSASGAIAFQPTSGLSFNGTLNASKDLAVLSPVDLHAAMVDNDSRLAVFVKPATGVSTAQLAGTWPAAFDKGFGTVTVNSAGKITGTLNFGSVVATLSGTGTLSADGVFSATMVTTGPGTKETTHMRGTLDFNRDTLVFGQPNSGSNGNDDLIVAVRSSAGPAVAKPTISVTAKPTASEIGPKAGSFTLSRAGGDLKSPLTVTYTMSGTATNGVDYTLLTGTATFPAGKPTVVISLTPVDDQTVEAAETAVLTVGAGEAYTVNAAKSSATVTIADSSPKVTILANRPKASENKPTTAGKGQFMVKRSGGNIKSAVTVLYSIGGTATNGVDYPLLTGSVVIPAGRPFASIDLIPLADSVADPNETVILTLLQDGNPSYVLGSPASATVTIAGP
jgi:hypothetical protein